ncbi:POTRA domain-containing protein [Tenacibaculum maritimum]|uniref:POTRA domain-containing protein n=1 Tax=Tenacibaculum maritimum TaxID=107401 RepID=UPI0038761237
MRSLTVILFFMFSSIFGQEKRVSDIVFQGNTKTKASFLFKIIETKVGGVVNRKLLDKDVIRLKRLAAVANATVYVKEGSKIVFAIEENFTLIPDVNIWTTTNKRFAYRVGGNEFNLFGSNITVGGFYQNNGFNTYGINFKAPNLFSRNFGLAFYHQNWKSEEPLYFKDQSVNYLYNNISFEILGLYELNFKNHFQLGINFFNEKYDYLKGALPQGVPLSLDLNKRLLKLIYTFDDLNYFYQYISGFKSEFYGQYVTSVNKYQDDFLVAWNDLLYFKRVGERGNWANRLRVGLSSNNKTPFAPFALDNNVNLRGVGILVDRGTGSIVYNTEYRYTLYEKRWFILQGNAFMDAGTWREPGEELKDFFKSENIKVYSGIGLRCMHKKIYNAVFRIDYGYGLTKNSSKGFVFGIGQYF